MALWEAGQKRIGREARERLGELYTGVRDGYVAGNIATKKVKAKGRAQLPPYLRTPETRKGLTGGALEQAVDRFLAKMSPGRGMIH